MYTSMCVARPPPTPQATKRDYISFSAISLYQACPLRYHFRYVAGLPEEFVSSNLVFGSALHASVQFHFEQLLSGQSAPHLDTLLEVFQEHWARTSVNEVRFGKGENRDTLGSLADRMLRVFQASAHARPAGTILGVEEELRGPVVPGCPDLLARLDLIVDAGDALVINDFKTSRSSWGESRVTESANQHLLYHELARGLAGGKPVRLEFAVLTKTKTRALTLHDVSTDRFQIERTKRVVKRVWQAIRAGLVYPAVARAVSDLSLSTCVQILDRVNLIVAYQQKGGVMPNDVLLDEFDVSVLVSKELAAETVNAMLKTLSSAGFRARLRRAIWDCFREFPSLTETRIRISR